MAAKRNGLLYVQMAEADEAHTPPLVASWKRSGSCLFVLACLAAAFLCGTMAGSRPSTTAPPIVTFQDPSLSVFPSFQGPTAKYGGFGYASGGRYSASVQRLFAGSKSSAFLLDHRFQYIVEGETYITDGTGQTFSGKAGDLFYLPYGSNVTQYTPKSALTYVSVADEMSPIRPQQFNNLQPAEFKKWLNESAYATRIQYFSDIKSRFQNTYIRPKDNISHIYFEGAGCWKWNASQLPANTWMKRPHDLDSPNWNFCSGVLHLQSGPPAFTSAIYPNHEELDLVIDGEFNLMDATGHNFTVRKGDLIHNLRHMDVRIETHSKGAWLTTSLSPKDDFFTDRRRRSRAS